MLLLCLALPSALAALRPTPTAALRAPQHGHGREQRARKLLAQNSWNAGQPGFDSPQGFQQGFPQQQQGFPQQQQQGFQQQGYGAQACWHLVPATGVLSQYSVTNGQEQVLSRFDMAEQKLTVSRVQCLVQVAPDGTATLLSFGKRPTGLRRRVGAPWYGLQEGVHVLLDGEQIALDMDSGEPLGWQGVPYTAVYTVHEEKADIGMGYAQQQQQQQQLPYPWVELVDPNGSVDYSNPQTGAASWDPPQQGYPQ